MPGKTSEGFVKAAQKQKFVRNRDLKLKDSELKREAHIQHVMVDGVCDKCREKLQWRFKYNKYKSLTRPGSCQSCKNKNITKAYRTYCDTCAKNREVCPGCCGNIQEINAFKKAQREAAALKMPSKDVGMGEIDGENGSDEDLAGEKIPSDEKEDEEISKDSCEGEVGCGSESEEITKNTMGLISDKDFRKIEDYGKSKYDKNRVVGSKQDKVVVSIFSSTSAESTT